MALKDWFSGLLLLGVPESPPVEMREAAGVTVGEDADEAQWRRLSGNTDRDLAPMSQERMQKIASKLWESNLLANRLVELLVAYLIAEGVRLTVEDESNQQVLDQFWRDPINDLSNKLPMYIREMELYGEQCYPAFVNEATGAVRLGYLDPLLISEVVMDPDNPSQPIGVVTKKNTKGEYKKYQVIINGPEDCFTARTQQIRARDFTDGPCFLFQINKLASGRRGRSSLLPQADWVDSYDEYLFGEMDRAKFMRAFFWDVTLKNATPEAVAKRAKEITPPSPGSVRVHNDSEEWKAEAPNLQAGDSAEHARLFRNHVLGGATVPETWYGGGGDVNRAAAAEMGEPTFKVYSLRQGMWKNFLQCIGLFALRHQGGKVTEPKFNDPAYAVTAEFPELTASDTTKWAAAMQQVASSMMISINQGLVTELTAVRLLGAMAARLGVEFDAEKELESAQAAAAKKREADNFSGDPAQDGGTAGVNANAMSAASAAAAKIAAKEALHEAAPNQTALNAFTATLDEMREASDAQFAEMAQRISVAQRDSKPDAPPLDAAALMESVRGIVAQQHTQFEAALATMRESVSEIAARPVEINLPKPGKRTVTTSDGRTITLNPPEAPADETAPET